MARSFNSTLSLSIVIGALTDDATHEFSNFFLPSFVDFFLFHPLVYWRVFFWDDIQPPNRGVSL